MITEENIARNREFFGSDDEDDENEGDEQTGTFEQQQDDDEEQDLGQVDGEGGDEEDDPIPAEAVPEEEGHVNAEGLMYQQPRSPFAGTIYNGVLNGFPRLNQENVRRPSGNRPNGYVLSMAINGYRRTLAQALADEDRLAEQARTRGTNLNYRGTKLELFGTDVPNHSLLEMPWYIVATGTNAPLYWFDLICAACENAIIKFGSHYSPQVGDDAV